MDNKPLLPSEGVVAVIFDVDGTLYDKSRLALRLIFSDLRHALILGSERLARRDLRGKAFADGDAFYSELFVRMSRYGMVSAEGARKWYFEDYMPLTVRLLRQYYKAYDYVLPMLKELRARGIVTAVFSDYGCVDEKLRALGIDPALFDYRFSAQELGGLKPNVELFGRVLSAMNVEAAGAVMVGDSDKSDGEGARRAGMRFVKVSRPQQ